MEQSIHNIFKHNEALQDSFLLYVAINFIGSTSFVTE